MKKVLGLALLFSLLIVGVAPALADGGMYSYDPFANRWDHVNETVQQAFINYNSGLEKMIIGTDFENKNNQDVLWIFPIPADPQQVVIDVVTKYPDLSGEELSTGVQSAMDDFSKVIYGTQIYPLPFLSRRYYTTASYGDATGLGAGSSGMSKGIDSDVVVYEEINKEGITTEVITAQTANGLYDHIRSKGIKIDNGALPAYSPYIGKNYTFVISWINKTVEQGIRTKLEEKFDYTLARLSKFPAWNTTLGDFENKNREALRTVDYPFARVGGVTSLVSFFKTNTDLKNVFLQIIEQNSSALQEFNSFYSGEQVRIQRGIFVSFPTDKLYFPLIPTSIYGSRVVPATIRIIGHVDPKIFSNIKPYTKISYFLDSYVLSNDPAESKLFFGEFNNNSRSNVKYTKIEINAPSKMFTEDLWVTRSAPFYTYWQTFIIIHPVVTAILILVFNSCLVSLLLGLLIFKEARRGKGWIKFLLVGLANFLTIIGFIIFVIFLPTKKIKEEDASLFEELKKRGYGSWLFKARDYRKLIYIPAFSLVFVAFSWLILMSISL